MIVYRSGWLAAVRRSCVLFVVSGGMFWVSVESRVVVEGEFVFEVEFFRGFV